MEKNSSSRLAVVAVIGLSEKSTSTTATRTVPRSGARSAAARAIAEIGVPTGNCSGGTMTPSLKPRRRGSRCRRRRGRSPSVTLSFAFASFWFHCSMSSGLAWTAHVCVR